MKKTIFYLVIGLLVTACYPKPDRAREYNYETECMGTGADGLQLVKVYSYAYSTEEAIARAKKDAVHAAVFKGFSGNGCANFGMLTDPNAEEKHGEYFNYFFQPNGAYLKFVNLSNDGSIDPADRTRVGNMVKVGVAVAVKYNALRSYLEKEGIVKSLDSGF